jgi:hypothetical protein
MADGSSDVGLVAEQEEDGDDEEKYRRAIGLVAHEADDYSEVNAGGSVGALERCKLKGGCATRLG